MTSSGPVAGFWEDPYPVYDDMHADGPVVWEEVSEAWWVVGYDAAREALTNDSLSSGWLSGGAFENIDAGILRHIRQWFMWTDPPTHRDLRAPITTKLTEKAVRERRDEITATVERYFAPMYGGTHDAITTFATPLVADLIASLVGFPAESRPAMCAWSEAAAGLLANPRDEMHVRRAEEALAALANAVSPTAGDSHTASLMAFAGVATTGEAIARMLDLEADGRLRETGASPESIVDELLRVDTPVPHVRRIATADTEIAGTPVAEGQAVVILIAAANRDPAVFERPDSFDPIRNGSRHISYGHGRHRCPGAILSDRILLAVLLRLHAAEQPTRDQPATWHRNRGYRAVANLPLTWQEKELDKT